MDIGVGFYYFVFNNVTKHILVGCAEQKTPFFISQLLSFGSLKFLVLPSIIGEIVGGVCEWVGHKN